MGSPVGDMYCLCNTLRMLVHPVECISDTKFGAPYSGDLLKFAVVSSCYYNRHWPETRNETEFETIRYLCEANPSGFDTLIWSQKVTYKNIFCFLCNIGYSIENDTLINEQFEVLKFTVMCPNQPYFIYAVNFTQLMDLAKTQGCRVTYETDKCIVCESEDKEVESGCPNLPLERPIKWLCKNTSVNSFEYVDKYKNEFCYLCNSIKTQKQTNEANSCLTTKEVPNICSGLKNTPGYLPFFCPGCDEYAKTKLAKNSTIHDCKPKFGYKVITHSLLRDLFSPARIIEDAMPTGMDAKNIGELCYPGKILRGGSCVSVIEYPQKITYELFVFCHLSVVSSTNNTATLLPTVKKSIYLALKEWYEIPQSIWLSNYFFIPENIYQTTFKNGMFHNLLYINLCFNVMYYTQFHRDETERNLMKLPQNLSITKVIERSNCTFELKGIRLTSIRQILLSNDSNLPGDMASFLLYKKQNFFMSPSTAVHVNPLMLCRQKSLRIAEVSIDNDNFRIKDKKNNIYFYGEFVHDFDGLFRVCVEEKQSSSDVNDYSDILEMFTNILNIISIVSMVTLLALYMIVPGLRTLPGLNTMNTLFSLLCMQLTYTVANVVEKSTLFCTLIGILLHYFWLSLCCCLLTFSLHMCRSFSDQGGNAHQHTNIRSIFGRSVIYCYVTPIFIITATIIPAYCIQNKIGYGTTLCFVEDFIQNVATFIAPLLITCVVNFVMFTITVIKIKSVQQIEKSKKDKSELMILLKLFSLTGIVWIIQIVDGILNISVFSFVAILITSSQGTIIFMSFASSPRILAYIKSKFKSNDEEEITDSRGTRHERSATSQSHLTKCTQTNDSSITI